VAREYAVKRVIETVHIFSALEREDFLPVLPPSSLVVAYS
jgi:hypothetical protein